MSSNKVNAEDHFAKLTRLIDLEEQEEIQQFQREFQDRSPVDREKAGLALLQLKLLEYHFNAAGHHLLSFSYATGKPLPLFSLDTGAVVSLTQDGVLEAKLPMGTVYEKDKTIITVAFDWIRPGWLHEEGVYHLSRAGNRATYKRMREALREAASASHSRLAHMRDISLGLKKPENGDPIADEDLQLHNTKLNQWQRGAVKVAMEAKDVALVHGPPGTGKTTVLVEIIQQHVRNGQFAFATAPSNTACDNLLECLVKAGVKAIRLGHPARIMRHLREYTLDFKLAQHSQTEWIDTLQHELDRLYTRLERQDARGGGLSREGRRDLKDEINHRKREIRLLESQIMDQVLDEAEVMVGTHASGKSGLLRRKELDLVVMDEASQSTEPTSWIPMVRAKKVILAGDHFQLPPTVRCIEAEAGGLAKTIFERLYGVLKGDFTALLRTQYRMNEKIMNFSSREFYDGRLIADESVKSHCLADLEHVERCPETEETFLYLDTSGRGFEEKLEPGSESRFNAEEADLVLHKLGQLLKLGVRAEDIAIIGPYSAQVRLLTSRVSDPAIEVDSVDGFQGREKEVVILSLVRSNMEGEMGFLADTRRMNVAMTRARRKLIVIGDSATLGTIPFYAHFISYAESIGAYRSSWDEI
ncbi:MAG: AAA domain-containing protein [Candidatus Omnitrophota bacterium]|nr:AAA domain-containing protein [Candidatus Omnitrophota bacterium]